MQEFKKRFIGVFICITLVMACFPFSTITMAAENKVKSSTGNLTIANEIEHELGGEHKIPEGIGFEITVTLSGKGTANATFTARKTGEKETQITTDSKGRFTITLEHDEQFEIFGLPAGTKATVKEKKYPKGFTPVYWDKGDLGDGKITVEGNVTLSVIVVNHYNPEKVNLANITVGGVKNLIGRDWETDDIFTFELQRYVGDDKWDTLGIATVNGTDADRHFDFNHAFDNEECSKTGSYYYRVIEHEDTSVKGITYDKTVHSFSVDITDSDMDGYLEIGRIHSHRPGTTHIIHPEDGSWHIDVDFNNHYSKNPSATVTIDLNKKLVNPSESPVPHLCGVTFGLYNKDTLLFTSPETTDRGFARFVLGYITEGTYEYTLKEIIPDPIPDGWVYSKKEIPITVVVTENDDGELDAVIYQGDTKPSDAGTSVSTYFTNTYSPKTAELKIDFADIELTDREHLSPHPLKFKIEQVDGKGKQMITGIADPESEKEGIEKIVFSDTLKFDKVGQYFFNMTETSPDEDGTITDKTVFRILVNVTDEGGALKADYVLVNAVGDDVHFHNTDKPGGDSDNDATGDKTDKNEEQNSSEIPENTDTSVENSDKTEIPKAGDNHSPLLWFAVLFISSMVAFITVILRKQIDDL